MHKTVAGVAFALATLLGSAACSATEQEETAPQTDVAPPEEAPVPMEEEAPAEEEEAPAATSNSDGVFTYELTGAQHQSSYVDVIDTELTPDEDTFFVVDVTATNESDQPADAPDPWMLDDIIGIDEQGRAHIPDDEPWTEDVVTNPGSSVDYSVVWDLPQGVELEYVEFAANEADGVAHVEVP